MDLVLFHVLLSFISTLGQGEDTGQLSFDFYDISILTKQAVNISKCSITYNYADDNIDSNGSFYVAFSEFDEFNERTFHDRVYVSHISTNGIQNFSIGNYSNSKLPISKQTISSPISQDSNNTYNPSIAIGSQSSFIVYDSYHPEISSTENIYVKYHNLEMSHSVQSLPQISTQFTFPEVKYVQTLQTSADDYYVLIYALNGNDIAFYAMSDNQGVKSIINNWVDITWTSGSVTVNNTKIEQFVNSNGPTPQWLIAYDVIKDDDSNEIYGHPFWWDVVSDGDGGGDPDYDATRTQLSNTECGLTRECKVILQDIASSKYICGMNPFDAFLVVYTVDGRITMDLVRSQRIDTEDSQIGRIWDNSFYPLDDLGNDVYVGDIQQTGMVNIYPIDDPIEYNQTDYFDNLSNYTDFFIMVYIADDNNVKLRSFYLTGCDTTEPEFGFLGNPKDMPSTTQYNPHQDHAGRQHSNLCLGPQENNKFAISWFEWSGDELNIISDTQEIKFNEYILFSTLFTYSYDTKSPTESPTMAPTGQPTAPTISPTLKPTADPTLAPTDNPTPDPTTRPTDNPTLGANSPTPPTNPPTESPTTTTTEYIPRNNVTSTTSTESTTESPVKSDASAALTSLTESPLKSPILILMLFIVGILVFISILAYLHNFNSKWFPCFWYTDDARVGALVVFAIQVWDFTSDANFTYCLYLIWSDFDDEYENNKTHEENADFMFTLFVVSLIFLVIPWSLNIIWIIVQRWRWTKHSLVNAWIRDYAWLLVTLCMVSGGANPAVNLCNSRIFALLPFQMELPRYEFIKYSRWPLFFVCMFENIPQILVQFAFVGYYSSQTDKCHIYDGDDEKMNGCTDALQSTGLASLSSLLAVILAFGICLLQCSDPLDDKRFILDIKLNDEEDEDNVRLQMGMRRRIAREIAKAINMHDSVITIDAIKWGYNKLKFVISVTESVKSNHVKNTNDDEVNNEMEENHYDELLNKLLSAKSNGKLALSLKKGLCLKYVPNVENIEIPSMSEEEMPNMDDMVQRLKKNIVDEKEVVIIASGGAKRALSYDDDIRIHQQSANLSDPLINIELQPQPIVAKDGDMDGDTTPGYINKQMSVIQDDDEDEIIVEKEEKKEKKEKKQKKIPDYVNKVISISEMDDDEIKDNEMMTPLSVPKVKALQKEGDNTKKTNGIHDYNHNEQDVDDVDDNTDDVLLSHNEESEDSEEILNAINDTHSFIE